MVKLKAQSTKVKPVGIKILLYGLASLIVINLLARFNIFNITGLQPDIVTIIAILFVATEIGVMSTIRGKKKIDGIGWFGVVVVGLAFLSLVLGWFGMTFSMLESLKGVVEIALLVFVILEIFR